MKKLQIRKAIFIFAASLAFALSANAQTPSLKSVAEYYNADGTFKYTDNDAFGNMLRNNEIDDLSFGYLNGDHWDGNTVSAPNGQDIEGIYLVNKATGEYLVLGDSWGTTPMSDYAGTMFNLRGGKTCRADNLTQLASFQVEGVDNVLGDKAGRAGKGYLIQFANDAERCIGRSQTASGTQGNFEVRTRMVDRSFLRKEYTFNPDDGADNVSKNNDDGQMIFYFHPVTGSDGKQYYIIYTHRQTTGPLHDSFYDAIPDNQYETKAIPWRKLSEYGNRDSYLCMKSERSDAGDYNIVRYKKFAGKMWYPITDNGQPQMIVTNPEDPEEDWIYETNPDYETWSNENYCYIAYAPNNSADVNRLWTNVFTNLYPGAEWGRPVGDELTFPGNTDPNLLDDDPDNDYDNDNFSYEDSGTQVVTLADGLDAVAADATCLWKIVTYTERKDFRKSASAENPADMSHLIENHKFYPTYMPYDIDGINRSNTLDFGWEWHNNETGTAHHEHSYKSSGVGTEFHKIGTHYYDRWGWGEEIPNNPNNREKGYWRAKTNERAMTQGEEANYVGSIYNGSAALRQTITDLRPGRYVVYCRAFYAPFAMDKLVYPEDGFYTHTVDESWVSNPDYDPNDEESKEEIIEYTHTYGYNLSQWNNGSTNVAVSSSNVGDKIDPSTLSNQSFLFAIGKDGVERKRDVPCIFAGMLPLTENTPRSSQASLNGISKGDYINRATNENFLFSPLGESYEKISIGSMVRQEYPDPNNPDNTIVEFVLPEGSATPSTVINNNIGHSYQDEYDLLKDETVFATVEYEGTKYIVPRNLTGAARFFDAVDRSKHANAFNYRIGLPVEVGSDGKLTIGIDHVKGVEGEWVCFDNFELLYYGVDDHYEFVCDQDNPKNNSIKEDFFGWETGANSPPDEDYGVKADVIIKRGLSTEKYVSLILPVNLTKKQAKQAFGDGVKITFPSRLGGKTIFLDALNLTDLGDDDIAMHAGVPYAVKPSAEPAIAENKTWERTEYAADLSPWDVEGWDATKKIFVPNVDRNSALQNAQITGPIYIASDVTITKNTFPRQAAYADDVRDNGEVGRKTADYYLPSEEWKAIGNDAPFFACGENDPVKGTIGKSYKILSGSADKQYRLVGLGYYNPADYTPGTTIPFNTWKHESATSEGRIPPYSYYLAGGKLYFNGKDGSTATKGLGFYLQVWEFDPKTVNIITFRTATNATPPNGTYSTGNTWSQEFTTNDASGYAGVKVKANWALAFGKSNGYNTRCFAIKPSAEGATSDEITIEAPDGYLIDGYEIGGWAFESGGSISETYTLKTGDESASLAINSKPATNNANQQPPSYLKTSGLGVESTTIKMVNSNSSNSWYALIPHFVVKLVAKTAKTSSGSSTGAKVFAGNIGDFQWVEITPMSEGDDGSETDGIAETYREFENPANDLYYDLQGRPVKTPRKNGIYIFHGKKIVY